MDADRRTLLRTKLLHRLVIVLAILGLAASVLAFIPSVEVYEDSRDCFGQALGRVFSHHSSRERTPCENNWVHTHTRPPVEHPAGMALYFITILLPGVFVWFVPRLRSAMLWWLWTIAATVVMGLATFRLFGDFLKRTVDLPLAHVFNACALGLVGTLSLLLPVACLVFAAATRTRPPPPPIFPTARVVER